MLITGSQPRFVTTTEAAALLRVSSRTVLNWIEADSIPYVVLPSSSGRRREYRIPLIPLLRSLSGNYDLVAELSALEKSAGDLSEEEIVDALADD